MLFKLQKIIVRRYSRYMTTLVVRDQFFYICVVFNKMRPILNNIVHFISRTQCRHQLSVSKQFIVFGKFSFFDALSYQLLAGFHLSPRWIVVIKCAYKCDSYAVFVISFSVSTLVVPTSTVVGGSVATDEEVITNVVPTPGFNMECLNETYIENTRALK